MGIIPQVIDTVIYINAGKIEEILQLKLTVKVPEGMISADLARPVIQVSSYLTEEIKYEIYSFGEQIVVMPMHELADIAESKINEYAQEAVQKKLSQLLDCPFLVKVKGPHDVNLYVPNEYKPRIIGR
ncbi:MAG: hypothetical protein GXP45_01915 [bacterium]|nr:hypothetical protein [bacterium]